MCFFLYFGVRNSIFILIIGYKSHKIVWRNKREAAGNLHSIEKDQNVSNRWIFISSLLLLLPLSLYHLTCGFADIQTTHPHFARLSLSRFSRADLGFSISIEKSHLSLDFSGLSNPKCVIHPHPEKIAEKRGGGGWGIRAWWCLWRWRESSRRGWRIGGRRLTSQLSGKMGSSSLSVELTLLSQPSLLYDSLSFPPLKSHRLYIKNQTFFLFKVSCLRSNVLRDWTVFPLWLKRRCLWTYNLVAVFLCYCVCLFDLMKHRFLCKLWNF